LPDARLIGQARLFRVGGKNKYLQITGGKIILYGGVNILRFNMGQQLLQRFQFPFYISQIPPLKVIVGQRVHIFV